MYVEDKATGEDQVDKLYEVTCKVQKSKMFVEQQWSADHLEWGRCANLYQYFLYCF